MLSKGHKYDVTTNIFEKLDGIVFFDKNDIENEEDEYVGIYGLLKTVRCEKYIKRSYIKAPDNFMKWKIFLPKSNGSGALGEVLSTPVIRQPAIGHTQSFISIGSLNTEYEAKALLKYIKTKFSRTMLGILKVTQDNKKSVWKYVPLQDFTQNSDIDWSKSVHEIDLQLYRKYGLDDKEIEFIETHVKEMA